MNNWDSPPLLITNYKLPVNAIYLETMEYKDIQRMLINHSMIWYGILPRTWSIFLGLRLGLYFYPRPWLMAEMAQCDSSILIYSDGPRASSSIVFHQVLRHSQAFSMTFQGLFSGAFHRGLEPSWTSWGFHALSGQSELGPKLRLSLWKFHQNVPKSVWILGKQHDISQMRTMVLKNIFTESFIPKIAQWCR